MLYFLFFFFFFQAEDGIRDYKVTGVQTCALPICQTGRAALRSHKDRCGSRLLAECWCLSVPLGMVESRLLQTQPAAPPPPPHPPAAARARPRSDARPPDRRAGPEARPRRPPPRGKAGRGGGGGGPRPPP